MTALYIIFGVLTAVIVLLFFPFTLSVASKDGAQTAVLWIGFVPVRLFPSTKRKKKEKTGEKKERKTGAKQKKKRERSVLHTVKLALAVVKKLFRLFGRNVRIKIIKCRIILGGEDPADTALLYGSLCAAVSSLTAFLSTLPSENTFNADILKTSRIRIGTDFLAEKTEIDFELRASVTLNGVLGLFFGILPTILNKGKKNDGKHSKRTHDLNGGKPEKTR